jgi:hypothetical protein
MSTLICKKSITSFALRSLPCAGILLFVQPLILAQACGKNVVEKYSPANDQEKAELDMEAGNFATAAERLNKVLADDTENYSARSLLAAAYAAQAGITTLGLIKNAAAAGASGQTGLTALNSALPTSTLDALAFMGQACDAMEAIPSESRTTEMKLQYSLFFSSYALLQIKYFTDNPSAIADLSVEDAAKLILTLAKASEAGGSSPLSTAVKTFATTLEQTPGSSIDKVKTVLTAKSSGSGG